MMVFAGASSKTGVCFVYMATAPTSPPRVRSKFVPAVPAFNTNKASEEGGSKPKPDGQRRASKFVPAVPAFNTALPAAAPIFAPAPNASLAIDTFPAPLVSPVENARQKAAQAAARINALIGKTNPAVASAAAVVPAFGYSQGGPVMSGREAAGQVF
jgi:hypothetical protein